MSTYRKSLWRLLLIPFSTQFHSILFTYSFSFSTWSSGSLKAGDMRHPYVCSLQCGAHFPGHVRGLQKDLTHWFSFKRQGTHFLSTLWILPSRDHSLLGKLVCLPPLEPCEYLLGSEPSPRSNHLINIGDQKQNNSTTLTVWDINR